MACRTSNLQLCILVQTWLCLAQVLSDTGYRLVTRPFSLDENIYFELLSPEEISFTYRIRPAKDFGVQLNVTLVHVELVPSEPQHGCSAISNNLYINGNVALIERSGCSFLTKTLNAEKAGAVAAIIYDNDHTNIDRMIDMIGDDTDRYTDIPAFFLLGKDGHMIREKLHELNLNSAVINIPINMTGMPLKRQNHPPWTLW